MNTLVYYFTGTGNSLHIGRKVTEKLEDAALLPLASILHEQNTHKVQAQVVGFVFPVYFLRMPEIVKEAIEKCIFRKDSYFFAVVTSGGDAGNALFELDAILTKKGCKLNYGVEIPLRDNSIVLRTSISDLQHRFSRVDDLVDKLIKAVKTRESDGDGSNFKKRYSSAIIGKVIHLAMTHYYRFEKQNVDASRCNSCGLCQRICPVNNISCKQGKVSIGKQCKMCFACLNYCPLQAISFGRIHPQINTQYRISGVTAADIVEQNAKVF